MQFLSSLLRRRYLCLTILIIVNAPYLVQGQESGKKSEAALQKWLKKYPEADANRDGTLTENEAFEFRKSDKTSRVERSSESNRGQMPTQIDVAYGEHERQKLDFWKATSDLPTPVMIFFHGGSFKAGDKSAIQSRSILDECLMAGISVVSANYRLSTDSPFPAPMHDGARAVQWVRSKASEWNIDPDRISLSGSSAGATMALWIALHDDLADSESQDPVAQFSTRVRCACPHSGTASIEPSYFKQHAGITQIKGAILQLFGASSQAELERPETMALVREASPLTHVDASDPPLFLTYAGDPDDAPFSPETVHASWIHHVCLGLPLKLKYDALMIPCDLYYPSKPAAANAEIEFLKRMLVR